MLSYRVIRRLGYVRINNSLGQQELVRAFDEALAEFLDVEALLIDLRDTPSGGNSTVARGIMGRLVDRMLPYQRHELVAEFRSTGIRRVWDEYVAPRGSPFLKPIVVLVGRWTGSMGEGLAIGLNATRGALVLGQPMAHLLGANGEAVLPHSKIVVRVPTEKLSHIDGTPREAIVPCAISSADPDSLAQDRDLEAAIASALNLSASKSNASVQPRCYGADCSGKQCL
jgi:carboxyl-terminal processing protease